MNNLLIEEKEVLSSLEVGNYQIRLRPLTLEDAAQTFVWRNSNRARYLNSSSITIEAQKKWISLRPENELNFIIVNNKNDVGMISLVNIDLKNFNAEAGRFLLGEEELTKGSSTAIEATLMLYDIAFQILGLNRVYGYVSSENNMMIKFHKYLGMKEEGVMAKHYYNGKYFTDAVILGLLREEFIKNLQPKALRLLNLVR